MSCIRMARNSGWMVDRIVMRELYRRHEIVISPCNMANQLEDQLYTIRHRVYIPARNMLPKNYYIFFSVSLAHSHSRHSTPWVRITGVSRRPVGLQHSSKSRVPAAVLPLTVSFFSFLHSFSFSFLSSSRFQLPTHAICKKHTVIQVFMFTEKEGICVPENSRG